MVAKYILCILSFVALGVPLLGQTRFDVTMTVDSVQREFIVVRPSGLAPNGGYPLVFMFHGTSGDGERFYNISGWKEKGEAQKFITVFPSALEYCFINDNGNPVQTTKWNNGEAQDAKCVGEVLKDDVEFVRRMIDTITSTFFIDTARIYASGFSNGGIFVSKLAVEMSDVFAAVAPAAAFLHELDSAAPVANIPIAYFIGDSDDRLLDQAGIPVVPFNDSCLMVLGGVAGTYLGAFNLTDTFTKDSTALSLTYRFTTPVSGLIPSSVYTLTLLKGLTHEYPNGVNYPIAAVNHLWPFFNQYTSIAKPNRQGTEEEEIRLYPNPAEDYLVVAGEGEMTLTLHTMLGECVFTTTGAYGAPIDLPNLPRGPYVAEISSARKRSVQLVVLK